MKKIIILIISILLTSGCYDNIELNNLSIISGIGIDYKDNLYNVTFEILNSNKSEVLSDLLSYTVNGKGNTLNDAFIDAGYRVSKKPYFAHMKILIISETIANDHLDNIIDYLFRDVNIRDEFKVVITDKPKDILNHNSKIHPVVSNYILELIESEKYNYGISINNTFKDIISKLISNKEDIIINSINIVDEDINLDKSVIFTKYKSKNILDKDMTSLFNLLNNNSNITLTNYYNNNLLKIKLMNSKTNINITDDKIEINIDANGNIIENETNFDFKKYKIFDDLNKDYNKVLEKKVEELIIYLQNNNSDILGFKNKYYKKYNKENNNLWLNAKIRINANIKINAKGFIFEVNNEK